MNIIQKSIPVIIALAAVVGAAGIFFYLNGKIADVNNETAILEGKLAQSTSRQEQLSSIKSLLADTKSARAQVDTYFLGHEGVVDFIQTIEGLGKASKVSVEIDSVNVEAGGSNSVVESVPLTLRLSGTFANVMRFVYVFERIPKLGGIRTAHFNRLDSASSTVWVATVGAQFSKLK
jgi:Tfp pilus assembly protein PilO